MGNDLIVRGNANEVHLFGNIVGHDLTVTNNTGTPTFVGASTVGHDARCSGNSGFSATANTAGHLNTCK